MGFSFKGSEGCFFGDVNVTEKCLFLQKWAEQVRELKVSLSIHDFMTIFSKVFETKLHPVCSTCTLLAQQSRNVIDIDIQPSSHQLFIKFPLS